MADDVDTLAAGFGRNVLCKLSGACFNRSRWWNAAGNDFDAFLGQSFADSAPVFDAWKFLTWES